MKSTRNACGGHAFRNFYLALIIVSGTASTVTLAPEELRLIPLSRGPGRLHHPVFTTHEIARHCFDQGLTLIFGFNHAAAMSLFEQALRHDPNLAMVQGGIGLAPGLNLNLPVTADAEKAAFESAGRAEKLAARASEAGPEYIPRTEPVPKAAVSTRGYEVGPLVRDFLRRLREHRISSRRLAAGAHRIFECWPRRLSASNPMPPRYEYRNGGLAVWRGRSDVVPLR